MPGTFAGTWAITPGSIIAGTKQFLGEHAFIVSSYSDLLFSFGFKIEGVVYDPEETNAMESRDGFQAKFVFNQVPYTVTCHLVVFGVLGHGLHPVILGILGRPGSSPESQDEEIVSFTAVRTGPPPPYIHGS